jgi:hypothetical protein
MKLRQFAVAGLVLAGPLIAVPTAGAQQSLSRLEVTGSPVRAGEAIQVASDGCGIWGDRVDVALLDPDGDVDATVAAVSVASVLEERWTVSMTVPAGTSPGVYPLVATCAVTEPDDPDSEVEQPPTEDGVDIDAPGAGHFFESTRVEVLAAEPPDGTTTTAAITPPLPPGPASSHQTPPGSQVAGTSVERTTLAFTGANPVVALLGATLLAAGAMLRRRYGNERKR